MSKPIKTKRLGNIQLTVWEGEYQGNKTFSFTVKKSYKNKNGSWENTDFFNKSDLPLVLALVQYEILGGINIKDVRPKEPEPQHGGDEIPYYGE